MAQVTIGATIKSVHVFSTGSVEQHREHRYGSKLAGLGFTAADVQKAVISHLHFDHVGGIADIPQTELLVSADEWQQLAGPHREHDWIWREHIELPGAVGRGQ